MRMHTVRKIIILLLVLGMLPFPWVTTEAETTYINNGDFNEDLSGWIKSNKSENGTMEAVDGAARLKADSGAMYLQQNPAGFKEGDRLVFSFRLRTKSLAPDAVALITIGYYNDSTYIYQMNKSYREITGDEWVNKSIEILMPTGGNKLNILLRLNGGGEVYYDDVAISDAQNETHLGIFSGDLELDTVPRGVGPLTAKLHYVPNGEESCNLLFAMYEEADGKSELTAIEVVPFTAGSTVVKTATLPAPQKDRRVSVAAFVWKNGQTLSPVAEQVLLPREGRSEVFDRFSAERMRGAYGAVVSMYDTETVNALLDAGCNTFILNIIGDFYGGNINKNMDALDTVCSDAEAFAAETGAEIFMKASFGANSVVSNTSFGAYHPGAEHSWSLPCPLSKEYWEKEMLSRLSVAAKHPGIIGVVFDMEMYSGGNSHYPNPCFCDTCTAAFLAANSSETAEALLKTAANDRRSFSWENKIYDSYYNWFQGEVTALTSEIRAALHAINPNLIIGYMPQLEWLPGITRGLGTEKMPVIVFNENEYKGSVSIARGLTAQIRRDNLPAVYTVGLWTNEENAINKSDLAAKIEEAGTINMGYWMYSINEINADTDYIAEIKKGNIALTNKLGNT